MTSTSKIDSFKTGDKIYYLDTDNSYKSGDGYVLRSREEFKKEFGLDDKILIQINKDKYNQNTFTVTKDQIERGFLTKTSNGGKSRKHRRHSKKTMKKKSRKHRK